MNSRKQQIHQWLTQAYYHLNRKDARQARANAAKALEVDPGLVDALMAMGIAWAQENQPRKAFPWFHKAVVLKPDKLSVWQAFLEAGKRAGECDMPAQLTRQLMAQQQWANALPDSLLVTLTEILERAGQYDQVLYWLNRQSGAPETTTQAWGRGTRAWNLEMLNQTGEARQEALECLRMEPENFRAAVVMARLSLRDRQPQSALQYLAGIQPQQNPVNRAIIENLKGQALDQLGRYRLAFQAFKASNDLLKTVPASDDDALNPYSVGTAEMFSGIDWSQVPTVSEDKAAHADPAGQAGVTEAPPVFLLGFPRAGTTLLEKMLQSHPGITSIEEQPLIAPILAHFLDKVHRPEDLIRKISLTTPRQRLDLQRAYFEQRTKHLQASENQGHSPQVIVDKLPLNVIFTGLLAWLFPGARIILALRDPRDVALSCFFQLFQPNAAMRNFLDWPQTARFLLSSMKAGWAAVPPFENRVYVHRYEEFVTSPKQQVQSLLGFLGLDWQEEMADFQKNLAGQRINTPSYQRVTQTIDESRVQRWKNYAWAIDSEEETLRPLTEMLGYRW